MSGCRVLGATEINTKKSVVIILALERQVSGDLAIVAIICIEIRANYGTFPRGKIDGSEL